MLQSDFQTTAPSSDDTDFVWIDPYDFSYRREWAKIALIIGLMFVAFIPAMGAEFAWLDDQFVLSTETERSLGGILAHWLHPRVDTFYRPVAKTAVWLQSQLWAGRDALGYHVISVLLHGVNVLLLWRILYRLEVPGAIVAAGLFAVHPAVVQPVGWITQQPVVLGASFYLASLLLYLRYLGIARQQPVHPLEMREPQQETRWLYYLAALGLFIAAMLSDRNAVTLPIAVMLLAWWKLHRLTWRHAVEIAPFLLMGIAIFTVVIWAQQTRGDAHPWAWAPIDRLVVYGRGVWFHLATLIWPVSCVFVYPKWDLSKLTLIQLGFPLVMVGAAGALWRLRQRIGIAPFLVWILYAMLLAPTLLLIGLRESATYVADYQQYLAAGIVFAGVGAALAKLFCRITEYEFIHVSAATVALLGMAMLTWQQASLYQDSTTLWTHTLRHNPHSHAAKLQLGLVFLHDGQYDQAAALLRKAVELKPDDPVSLLKLGQAIEAQGDLEQSEAHYRKSLELSPEDSEAHRYLAALATRRGDQLQAVKHYQRALEIDPRDNMARNNLATSLARLGRIDEAIEHYREALRVNPRLVAAHLNLAKLLFDMGRFDEAREHLQQAVQIEPDNVGVHMATGSMLMQFKEFHNASRMFRQAVRLRSESPQAWNALGVSLSAQAQYTEAIECFGRALDLDPNYEDAQQNLEMARRQRGY